MNVQGPWGKAASGRPHQACEFSQVWGSAPATPPLPLSQSDPSWGTSTRQPSKTATWWGLSPSSHFTKQMCVWGPQAPTACCSTLYPVSSSKCTLPWADSQKHLVHCPCWVLRVGRWLSVFQMKAWLISPSALEVRGTTETKFFSPG